MRRLPVIIREIEAKVRKSILIEFSDIDEDAFPGWQVSVLIDAPRYWSAFGGFGF